jgi:hypothetical protein
MEANILIIHLYFWLIIKTKLKNCVDLFLNGNLNPQKSLDFQFFEKSHRPPDQCNGMFLSIF